MSHFVLYTVHNTMSDYGGDDSQPDYALPISALPPKVIPQEESQMEVSASPAFQCLDDVSSLYILE